jgi:hypothetical protein
VRGLHLTTIVLNVHNHVCVVLRDKIVVIVVLSGALELLQLVKIVLPA